MKKEFWVLSNEFQLFSALIPWDSKKNENQLNCCDWSPTDWKDWRKVMFKKKWIFFCELKEVDSESIFVMRVMMDDWEPALT